MKLRSKSDIMEDDGHNNIAADDDDHSGYDQENITFSQEPLESRMMIAGDHFSRSHQLVPFSRTHSKEEKKANAQVGKVQDY